MIVAPAQAGAHPVWIDRANGLRWIPAFAGTTVKAIRSAAH